MNDDSLFWDDYTHSDFRGRGLHKDLNQFRTVKAAEYGKKRVLTIVASYNLLRVLVLNDQALFFYPICKIPIG